MVQFKITLGLCPQARPTRALLTTRLAPSPATEALSVVTSLKAARNARLSTSTAHHPDEHSNVMSLKLALFNLQKYVKEEEFSVELMMRGGVSDLVDLVRREEAGLSGNTLAVSRNRRLPRFANQSTLYKVFEDCSSSRRRGTTFRTPSRIACLG